MSTILRNWCQNRLHWKISQFIVKSISPAKGFYFLQSMMTRTRKYSNIRILSWPNIRIHFFPTNPSPKRRIIQTTPRDGAGTVVYTNAKDLYEIPMGSAQRGRRMQVGWAKIAFLTNWEVSGSHHTLPPKFVSIRYGDPRPRRCPDGGIRGVINNVGSLESLSYVHATHFTWDIACALWDSWVCYKDVRTKLCKQQVPNKRQQLLKCLSDWHVICLR